MVSPALSHSEVSSLFFLEDARQTLQYVRWMRSLMMSHKLASLYWDLSQMPDASLHEIFIPKTNFRLNNP